MVCSSDFERRPRTRCATDEAPAPNERMSRARAFARWIFPLRRTVEWTLRLGVDDGDPADVRKRIRLCNIYAVGGVVIMAAWVVIELVFGEVRNVPLEIGLVAGFLAVLVLNATGTHRIGRLLLIIMANACVLVGAVLFTEPSGGMLPFFALAAFSLLMFGPGEWAWAALSAALPVLLLAACQSGLTCRLLSVQPRTALGWYFAAN